MSVSVQAGLDEGLRHRARAARNQRVLQHAGKIVLRGGLEPGRCQGLRARIAIDERVERLARTGLVVVDERAPQDGEHPEPVGDQDVVEQVPELAVG